jgi:predicted DNA-binding transcriptional regulator AlpA
MSIALSRDKCPRTIGQSTVILMSAETLGERLGFSVRTIWRLKSAGKLPQPVRIGGSFRWRADEIEAWVQAGCPDKNDRNSP